MNYLRNNKYGFTLFEIMVTVSIIMFLAMISVYMYRIAIAHGRDTTRIASLERISKALELYYDDNLHYPPLDAIFTSGAVCGGAIGGSTDDWCDLENALDPYI